MEWWEHALEAFAAGRRASKQRAAAEAAAREERASEQRATFAEATPATPKKPRAKSCCLTNRRLKPE